MTPNETGVASQISILGFGCNCESPDTTKHPIVNFISTDVPSPEINKSITFSQLIYCVIDLFHNIFDWKSLAEIQVPINFLALPILNPQFLIPNPQSSIPTPQSPILSPQFSILNSHHQSSIINPQSSLPNSQYLILILKSWDFSDLARVCQY